ncbi:MAG: bifunctional methylenetetrahydrofolate dehydrogenase/methenyltetrahydrofolate cyclohydrolase FolD [Clostridia bacterium]|nr:bifunctional methylenetetrahydrofolate dehydrogenase/methenyltetrahydrofolate cyclohydrolase FolD [Clostridia bacterium]
MLDKIIDGKALAASIRGEIAAEISEKGYAPGLAVVMVGDNPSSAVYVRNKRRACEEVGIRSFAHFLPEETSQNQLEDLVLDLVADPEIHGILVQLPLPAHIDAEKVLSLIPAEKDVDGFSAVNVGNMLLGNECLKACTPQGIVELIRYSGTEIAGKHAVVVGRSNIVGKPAAILLLAESATVTVCHSRTKNLAEITKLADILVVAVGKPEFIVADMVKEGAIVIDVGTNRVDGKLVGDVDFGSVYEKAGRITPVPGGVGPMTIAMLLKNTLSAYKRINGIY